MKINIQFPAWECNSQPIGKDEISVQIGCWAEDLVGALIESVGIGKLELIIKEKK